MFITEQGLYELISLLKCLIVICLDNMYLIHKIKEYGDPYENKIPVVDIIPENARKYINRKIDNIEKIHKQEVQNIQDKHHEEMDNQYKQWEYYYKQEKLNSNNQW